MVVTGDVTTQQDEGGIVALDGLLANLGEARPEPGRTVVVPGNHDVIWGTAPSTEERYRLFVDHFRASGYVTPYLAGIDFDDAGNRLTDHKPLLTSDEGWVIVAMNSTNYCGALLGVDGFDAGGWQATQGFVEETIGPDAVKGLERLRMMDAPRVEPIELKLLREDLGDLEDAGGRGSPVRIAALHHHLLPVSTDEEIKAFESLTNLGEIREFLRSNNIRVVLHGHKHCATIYTDHVYPARGLSEGAPHRVLVVAGAMPAQPGSGSDPAFRVLDVPEDLRAPRVEIRSYTGVSPGTALPDPGLMSVPLWPGAPEPADSSPHEIVVADNFSELYLRVVALVAQHDSRQNVLCGLLEPATADAMPDGYPDLPGVSDRNGWFKRHRRLVAEARFKSRRAGVFHAWESSCPEAC